MTAAAARATAAPLREPLLCAAVAAAASAVAVLVVPRGGDLAAHLYRTDLVRHGILVWDNLWFAGQYPLASYSLLYYLLAAAVGNAALGIAGVVGAAALFASVAHREWSAHGRWAARSFALLLAGQAFTAAYPFDLGVGMLLATLWALQRRLTWLAVCCTLLTLGFSPLAFLFLALTLLSLFLHGRRLTRQSVATAVALLAAGGAQLAVLVLLPTPGLFYPYGTWRLLAGLGVSGLGVALALRGRGGRLLAVIFAVWAAASVVADLVPSAVGHNIVRASVFVVPLMLVAAARVGFRPRWLAATALAAAVAANVLPYSVMIGDRSSSADSRPAFWQPVLAFLRAHRSADNRIEVIPTANHWEAYYFPAAGFALARGWYRQLDIADNPTLYARTLTPAAYRGWLRRHAVRYVVVPRLPPEAIDGAREARLARSPRTGLREVWRGRSATVYELPLATPLLTGPGAAAVVELGSRRIEGWVGRPGRYLLRVRYSPYWILDGAGCVAPARGAMTTLELRRPGRFAITAVETPGGVVATLLGPDRSRCPS